MPALFSVMEDGLLPSVFNIVGYARRDWSDEHLREMMYEAVKTYSRYKPGSSDDTMWDGFASNLSYVQGGFGELDRFKALVLPGGSSKLVQRNRSEHRGGGDGSGLRGGLAADHHRKAIWD